MNIKKEQIGIRIPAELKRQVDQLLYSHVEGAVPYGALTSLIIQLLEEYVARRKTLNRSLETEISRMTQTTKEQSE